LQAADESAYLPSSVISPSLILPRAILFDMDGTLTRPLLDFPQIKAEMGIGNRPILEALAELDPARRAAAQSILHRHEEEASANSTLNPGCAELLEWLNRHRIQVALVTRNSRRSVRTVLERHGLRIDVLITRDDALPKPDPAPLRLACARLDVNQAEAWMVGDGVYDIQAGVAAGIATVWVSHGRVRSFDAVPWREVIDLPALLAMLQGSSGALK
jgi:HAD superfamily hydrolase (TIGR01509 family)